MPVSEQVKLYDPNKSITLKELALELAKCEHEDEVIKLLKECGYWDNDDMWRSFGDNENNFSIIGNQQSAPDTALVEKLINSIDAVLMRLCFEKNLDPEGDKAPKNIQEALKLFLNIPEGKLSNLDVAVRNKLSKEIMLIATGSKASPHIIIIPVTTFF